ncbi:hypothetical protein ABIF65_003332 [Bradyrhizobium japonicum]|jgi:hypothetical protein|nr:MULTISPECIES: hypothetical protein [Bradyrhizobium]MBR0882371.1 hypothetical protein [Bradyrhizobium liaoningense]MBR0947387.1 hypothetical protein [Bradyrhizobium liaoningense]MBR1068694.1 hypothetical protein [Bradyrhizobium liaoningense]MCP1766294.1 hypothetical protein [Bradyrhizobium japonicum]MCP1779883.1 hypothetical protein [Bradyrhizobium japonicum]
MDDDLLSWAMLGTVLLSLGITTIVIAWPLEGERGAAWRIIRARWPR